MCKKQTHKLDTHSSSYKLFESKCIYIRRGDERELDSCPEIQIPGGEEAQQSFRTSLFSNQTPSKNVQNQSFANTQNEFKHDDAHEEERLDKKFFSAEYGLYSHLQVQTLLPIGR
jgi:hypothetical protein